MDFSPDGKRLLVMKYVSAAESYPGVVDVATGKLELFPVDGGKAAFGGFAFAPDGKRGVLRLRRAAARARRRNSRPCATTIRPAASSKC